MFVFPPEHWGREASLPCIRSVSSIEACALEGVARAPGPRLIVIQGIHPAWRLVSYYFPEDWIEQGGVVAHANRARPGGAPPGLRSLVVVNERGGVSTEASE